jgi:hypothetical protein
MYLVVGYAAPEQTASGAIVADSAERVKWQMAAPG